MIERLREFLRRLLRRAPPQPGRFVSGSRFAWRGRLDAAPWTWPSREYLLYVPRGYGGWSRRALVVLLHGCRQGPEEIAAATRIAEAADRHGWLVLLPRQSQKANSWRCWNWFDFATAWGRGEAAIVAAQVAAVRRAWRVHPRRVFVAGMSAGGALAAALGVRHPQLFAGIFVHSGLACGAASGPAAALRVMKEGPDTDVREAGAMARGAARVRLPLCVVHGGRDEVVVPAHAHALVRQYLALNGCPDRGGHGVRPPPDHEAEIDAGEGRRMRVAEYRDGRRLVARLVEVADLGHAWSGGVAEHAFNDPLPPRATELLADFVEGRGRAR